MRWWKKNNKKLPPWLFLWMLISPVAAYPQQASVLATGDWVKLGVTTNGVYKIDAAFLRKNGIDLGDASSNQIQLFGNGNGVLPQPIKTPRISDLQPVAIEIETGQNGNTEAIYFYGEGPARIFYDPVEKRYKHEINPYTDTTFYFLSLNASNISRIQSQNSKPDAASKSVHFFEDYWYYEKEAHNLLRSGREWWGDYLGTTNQLNLEIDFPGINYDQPITLAFSAIAAAQTETKFNWTNNGKLIGGETAGIVSTYRYDLKAQKVSGKYDFTPEGGEKIKLSLNYDKNGQPSASAYLNFVSLQVRRTLRSFSAPVIYRFPPEDSESKTLTFDDLPTDFVLWDIRNPLRPSRLNLFRNEKETGAVLQNATEGANLIGFTKKQALSPASSKRIPNQNIHAEQVPDMIIVAPETWLTEAKRLAEFRSSNDGLEVSVFTPSQIFNEFASGAPDVTAIRDFCRYFYQQKPGKLKYLLLFGDATYDFRNREQLYSPQQRASWVPAYQSRESLHPVYTYASDDYFAMLDEKAGEWSEDESGDHALQIGVGRLPVKTKSEATLVVQKLLDYANSSVSGPWKKKITFVADNGDSNIHQQHADALATMAGSEYLTSRVFTDEYPLTVTSLGNRAPIVNREIKRKINDGSLILNFTGHGNESGWTDEQILTLADMQSIGGYNNMPVLVTATCEFGRYDNPAVVSGAELMLLSPRGAAIGALTTTRPVFSSTNFAINRAFYQALLSGKSRLGDIFVHTKNESFAGALNRNFSLLGDPSMRLALPQKKIRWNSDTLRPHELISIEGEIFEPQTGLTDRTFNGTAEITLFDQQTTFKTLGAMGTATSYKEYRNRLFTGTVTVVNGKFTLKFRMPDEEKKEIRQGIAVIYARSNSGQEDAASQVGTVLGPGKSPPLADTEAPVVRAFLNDSTFTDNQEVAPNPTLIVKVSDNIGLTMSGFEGHCQVSAILNDTLELPVSEYYIADTDSYRAATIKMPVELQTEGIHRIVLSFCDLAGNKTEKSIVFRIRKDSGIKVRSAILFPNPFQNELNYRLEHNRTGHDLIVRLRIYSRDGRMLFEDESTFYNAPVRLMRKIIPFNSTKAEPQLYLYELTVRSLVDMTKDRQSGKLIRRD